MWDEVMSITKKAFEYTKEQDYNDINYRRFYECTLNLLKPDFVYPTIINWPDHQVINMMEDGRGSIVSVPLPSPTLPRPSSMLMDSNAPEIPALVSAPAPAPAPVPPALARPLARHAISLAATEKTTAKKKKAVVDEEDAAEEEQEICEIIEFPSIDENSGEKLWPNGLPKIKINGEKVRGPRQTSIKILKHASMFEKSVLDIAEKVKNGEIKTSNGGGGWPQVFPRIYTTKEDGETKNYFNLKQVCEEIVNPTFTKDKYAGLKEIAAAKLVELEKKAQVSKKRRVNVSSLKTTSSSSSSSSSSAFLSQLLSSSTSSSSSSDAVAAPEDEEEIPPPPPLLTEDEMAAEN